MEDKYNKEHILNGAFHEQMKQYQNQRYEFEKQISDKNLKIQQLEEELSSLKK